MAHNNDGIGRIQKGTYYIPQISHDVNVGFFMKEALGDMVSGYLAFNKLANYLQISTSNSWSMDIPNSGIDYIFTDPPYAEKVQYGELNFVWEAWLQLDTNWHDDEIVVNDVRNKTEADWARKMSQSLRECFRVLKPGRRISLCYHDTSEGTWQLVQDLMSSEGFLVEKTESALFIDTKTKTTNQYFADKVNKRDLIINFRKPKPSEAGGIVITELDDFASFNTKVCNIIMDYISKNPGSTKDHIFDEVVSRMVRRGQMEAHRFEDLLLQVAEPVYLEGAEGKSARWYLRETEDAAESAKEDFAAAVINKFIEERIKAKPEYEGVHYSDLFEHYVSSVNDMPRRKLADWLLDYFYKTDEGTYRLPASPEEEQIKKEGRSQGVSRRIKRYLAYLEQGVPVPVGERPGDAAIADWIRHCKRSGTYEQGKLLYEKGGLNLESLTEESQVNVDEDYQICGKMLARAGGSEKRTKRSRKAGTAVEI